MHLIFTIAPAFPIVVFLLPPVLFSWYTAVHKATEHITRVMKVCTFSPALLRLNKCFTLELCHIQTTSPVLLQLLQMMTVFLVVSECWHLWCLAYLNQSFQNMICQLEIFFLYSIPFICHFLVQTNCASQYFNYRYDIRLHYFKHR